MMGWKAKRTRVLLAPIAAKALSKNKSPIPNPRKPLLKSAAKAGSSMGENPVVVRAAIPNAVNAMMALKAFIQRLEILRLYSVKMRHANAKQRLAANA